MATPKTPRPPKAPPNPRSGPPKGFEPLPPAPETHLGSMIDPARAWYHKLTRYNPIRNLTPDSLSRQMDAFEQGYLREFALTMEVIARRDDRLSCVIPKRKAACARRRWEVITIADGDESNDEEAKAHKAALTAFYNNIVVTNAVDMNQRRGMSLLIDQMLDAQAKGYAVHEILWRPQADGTLSAVFNFVPLWFFENRSGRLRFLQNDFDLIGTDLDDMNWMVTTGLKLMEPCAVAYMFKNLPMKDWLLYCEKHGMPGVHGKTDHAMGSPGWENLTTAVQSIAADFSCVTSKSDEIEKIDFTAEGQLPYPVLVERMDRAISAIWRGGDLSTMSKDNQAVGSNAQQEGEDVFEQDDALLVSETLNAQVDKKVIEWMFGEGVKPLAYIKIIVPPKVDYAKEIQIDDHLAKFGVPLGLKSMLERYGRAMPEEGEELVELRNPMMDASGEQVREGMEGMRGDESEEELAFADEQFANMKLGRAAFERRFLKNAMRLMARSTSEALAPLRQSVRAILEMPNEALQRQALETFSGQLQHQLRRVNENPSNAAALENIMASALLNGLAQARTRHTK